MMKGIPQNYFYYIVTKLFIKGLKSSAKRKTFNSGGNSTERKLPETKIDEFHKVETNARREQESEVLVNIENKKQCPVILLNTVMFC